MRQKKKNVQNQGSNDKKKGFFGSAPKSQMGSLSVKNASEKISRLGTFESNFLIFALSYICLSVCVALTNICQCEIQIA
jgi:hypothetical protein